MRILTLVLLLFFGSAVSLSLQAQCLVLDDLLAIGAEPTALATPKVVTARLSSEWTYNGPTATSRETFWTTPAENGSTIFASRLMLRAQRPGQDVVLKTTQASCVRELRSALKDRKLEAQPVTCPSCEAVRYKGTDFDATIYSKMKGDYPFVVVIHQVPAGMVAAPAASGSSVKAP